MNVVTQPAVALISVLLLGALPAALRPQTNRFAEIAAQDAPGLVLSRETNSLRSGLFIDATNHVIVVRKGRVENTVYFAMWNVSSNTIHYFFPNKLACRFEVAMADSNGVPVPKTPGGEKVGNPPTDVPPSTPVWHTSRYGEGAFFLPPSADTLYTWGSPENNYDLQKWLPTWFDLKKPGTYTLSFTQRIYIPTYSTNGVLLRPIRFQPVNVTVQVE